MPGNTQVNPSMERMEPADQLSLNPDSETIAKADPLKEQLNLADIIPTPEIPPSPLRKGRGPG